MKINPKLLLDVIYPVGSYYETSNASFNPNTAWGGTWVEDSKGRVLVGQDTNDADFDTIGETGGSKYLQKHKHTEINWLADTSYPLSLNTGSTGGYAITNWSSGVGSGRIGTNEAGTGESGNLQPYIVVKRWHRTA